MREFKHISPTSFNLFYSNRYLFYGKYLSDTRVVFEQTYPMAAGIGFDCYIKYVNDEDKRDSEIKRGIDIKNDGVKHKSMCDWAHKAGSELSDVYLRDQYVVDSNKRICDVEVEAEYRGEVLVDWVGRVPLVGKPDMIARDNNGNRVIVDWKVNGYGSKYGASFKRGYVYGSRTKNSHRDCVLLRSAGGIEYNACGMRDSNEEWYVQLMIYALMVNSRDIISNRGSDGSGSTGGSTDPRYDSNISSMNYSSYIDELKSKMKSTVIGIDQIACKGDEVGVGVYRGMADDGSIVIDKIGYMWDKIQSGVVWDDGRNDEVCRMLDKDPDAYMMFI